MKSPFHTCTENTRASSSRRRIMDITDDSQLNTDASSKASGDPRATASSSPAVEVTTKESIDHARIR